MNSNQEYHHHGWTSTPMDVDRGDPHLYAHTTDDIPLSKISVEEEKYRQYNFPSNIEQENNNNKNSVNSIYQLKQSKVSLLAKPLFSVAISAFLSIALLLLFLHADGKYLDYTIIGLKIPTLVSLIVSVNLIFIASGVSTAIAEYKWVQLQNGAKLNLIDVYDGCARGLSGFAMTIRANHFDIVLIVALIFHLGFLAVSPASQAILVAQSSNYTVSNLTSIRFYHYPPDDAGDGRNGLLESGQAPMINGLANNGYITASSFAQAAVGSNPTPNFVCANGADFCRFNNTQYISTSMTCKNITGSDTAIVNRSGTNRTVVILDEYFTQLNITYGKIKFPKFLYSTEMLGRTYYDLANYTPPAMPGLNIPLTQASATVYDPQYRPYVGDQIFVMAYKADQQYEWAVSNYTELAYKKCWLTSSLNTSTWQTANGTLKQVSVESSVPIVMDYDNILGNNIALRAKNATTSIMVNAYVMQQAILYELTTPKYYTMSDYIFNYLLAFTNVTALTVFDDFMKVALPAFDYAFFQAPYISSQFGSLRLRINQGSAYFSLQTQYKVNKQDVYVLCLCLFLPIIWWFVVWLISLKKNGGVARGSSQIALLTAGMTPVAQQTLRGFSNLDSSNAFKRAQTMRIRLGRHNNQVAFGMENENNLGPLNKL